MAFVLEDHQKAALAYMIHADQLDADIQRRIDHAISEGTDPASSLGQKYAACVSRMRAEWAPKLESAPEDDKAFIEMVCKHPDYKDRKARG